MKPSPQSDMNVTPLIDVLLVLLVIFLAALPLAQEGLDADLPAEAGDQSPPNPSVHIVATYSANRQLTVNNQPVEVEHAQHFFENLYATRRDKTLFVIGHPTLRYGEVARIIDAAKGAGVSNVGIVTEGLQREARR